MKTIGKSIYLRVDTIFCVKKFTTVLSTIFVVLIASSIQSVIADDATLIGVDIIPTEDSNLQVHLQVIIRDSQGYLVSVTESTSGWTTIALEGNTIPGIVIVDGKKIITNLTDNVFNEEIEKEIVTIDDTKYEKVQWVDTTSSCEEKTCMDIHQNIGTWNINFYGDFNEFGFLNIPLFQAMTSTVILEDGDNITNQWTVLREMGE